MNPVKKILKKLLIKAGIIKKLPTDKPYTYSSFYPYMPLSNLSDDELLSLMRHEAHRIEKSTYNNIFKAKYSMYLEKAKRLDCIFLIFEKRNRFTTENTVLWAKKIRISFEDLYEGFISPNSSDAREYNFTHLDSFSKQISTRRSVRVWSKEQLQRTEWLEIAHTMIDSARWAPCSGNRQPWKFKILIDNEDKLLLDKLKEEHCTSAPLLIFVGMDRRVYGSLSNKDYETALFVDAGAAIMTMITGAHESGLGTCWNHFGRDLIESRKVNQEAYDRFCKKLNIEDYIEPVAILAVGLPKYIPPTPARMDIKDLLI
ncbi:nitroreductase family protein [Pseudoalteromonas sp. NZS37]|uniref:nitroreductase family protein n=1 Tax=Pseudoalteromonas sp. NZS37 TaxID=2792071 RepID=UPI0018CE1E15|nr:nitroreductase family protein [Pseudoalteromonas sp. NZS37]MBG9990002.1 nitroreductase family protein [Pseudoalteromonas sp. NZS37]